MTDTIIEEIDDQCNSKRSKTRKTNFRIQQIINDIGKMLSAGSLDREIMEQLQIKRSQYYEYKSRLFQQSAELFEQLNVQRRATLRKTNSSIQASGVGSDAE
jgi:hypothetical protein